MIKSEKSEKTELSESAELCMTETVRKLVLVTMSDGRPS